MTTIAREQLIEHAQNYIAHDTWLKEKFGEAHKTPATVELARIALASLEAEAVGEFYHEKQGGWYQISEGDKVPDDRRIQLFTAPPAQVVKLPNEFISSEGIVVQIEKVMAVLAVAGIRYERKGNACRVGMLKGDKS